MRNTEYIEPNEMKMIFLIDNFRSLYLYQIKTALNGQRLIIKDKTQTPTKILKNQTES